MKIEPLPLFPSILCGSIAGSVAELFTIPLDTAKVRLQIQGQKKAEMGDKFVPKYAGMFNCIKVIMQEEGPLALWKGIVAGLQRQIVFAGIRIGTYPFVRDLICGNLRPGQTPTLIQRIIAGLITGAVGISIACPTDVVKIRLQAEGRLPPGAQRRYNGTIDAYTKIIKNEGVVGLWTGIVPNILRNSIMNAAELASYDQIKTSILLRFPKLNPDTKLLHFFCGLSAGFFAVLIASPVDVIKTRVMNKPDVYNGVVDCVVKTLKIEGPMAFYNGFFANFWRVGTWNIIMFLTLEQCQIFVRKSLQKNKI